MTQPDARPYVWMLCGSFSFAVMAALAESLTRSAPGELPFCDWQTVAVFRSALVTVFSAVLAWRARVRLVFLRPLRLWVRSVAGSGSMVCTFYAFSRLDSRDVVTLSNTFPLWVAVLSWPLYGRSPGRKTVAAILVGVTGVVLVEQPHIEAGNLGVFAALFAAAFTAVAMLGLNRLKDIDPRAVVVHFSAVATVFCGSAFLFTPRTLPLARVTELEVLVRLIGIGVSATVGQVFLTLAFGRGAPAKVAVVGLTQIVFVTALGAWAFGHAVNTVALVGTALIMAPTAWLLSQSKATSTTKAPPQASENRAQPEPESETSAESRSSSFTAPQLRP